MKNQKFLTLAQMTFTDREETGRDKLLQKEGKQSLSQALTQVEGDPRAKEWLEKWLKEHEKDLW